MSTSTATLSSKFQISIPKEIRDSMGFKPGQKLAFLCIGNSVKLIVQPHYEDLFGIGKGGDPSNYRDRGTRREDSLPTAKVMPITAVQRKPAVRKAVRKNKRKLSV